jgi:CMP-N-acetylneuraminic acid synthetase
MKNKLKSKKILAIIPARGGSKRLPGKNIKPFFNRPLIAWTIENAKKSKFINKLIVSTDNKNIAEVSKEYGGEVIERPKKFAKDTTLIYEVIEHVTDHLYKNQKYKPDIIILLQPTSPLRTAKDIDRALKLFLKNECESVVSVYESDYPFYWSFKIAYKYLEPIFDKKYLKKRRQDLPKIYIPNGAIFIFTRDNLFKYKSLYSKKVLPYVMPRETSIDIDNEIDFKLAELLIKESK